MKKYMPLEGLRWSRDSGSTLCDTPQNGRSRTGWGGIQYRIWLLMSRSLDIPQTERSRYFSETDIISAE